MNDARERTSTAPPSSTKMRSISAAIASARRSASAHAAVHFCGGDGPQMWEQMGSHNKNGVNITSVEKTIFQKDLFEIKQS
jgi:hypothetical protein